MRKHKAATFKKFVVGLLVLFLLVQTAGIAGLSTKAEEAGPEATEEAYTETEAEAETAEETEAGSKETETGTSEETETEASEETEAEEEAPSEAPVVRAVAEDADLDAADAEDDDDFPGFGASYVPDVTPAEGEIDNGIPVRPWAILSGKSA